MNVKIMLKTMIFKIKNGKLYQDDKFLTEINQITTLKLKSVNKNHFINVFLKNPKIIIDHEQDVLRKNIYKIVNYTEKTPLSLNIDFLENKPEDVIEKLQKLIK